MATIYKPLIGIPLQYMNSAGDPDAGGTLEFFLAGGSTPTNIFSDNAGSSLGNTVTLDSLGFPASGGNVVALFRSTILSYKVVYKDASGTEIFTFDNLDGFFEIAGTAAIIPADAVSGGNEGSHTGAVASYIRQGRLVTISGRLTNINTAGLTAGNDIYFIGLPYAAGFLFNLGHIAFDNAAFDGQLTIELISGNTGFRVRETKTATGKDFMLVSEITTGTTDMDFHISYVTA